MYGQKVFIKYNCRDHMSDLYVDTQVVSRVYVTEEVLLLDKDHLIENTLKEYGFIDEDTIKDLYEDKKMCDYVYKELVEDTESPHYEIYIVYCNNIDSMDGISSYIYASRRENTWVHYPFPYCMIIFDGNKNIDNSLIIEILSGIADGESDDCNGSLYKLYNFNEAKDILEHIIDTNVPED